MHGFSEARRPLRTGRMVDPHMQWYVGWTMLTAFGWSIGTLVAWGIETGAVALLERFEKSDTVSDVWPAVAVSAGVFGLIVGLVQVRLLRQLLPDVGARQWGYASAVGWAIDSLLQWMVIGPATGFLQARVLRPRISNTAAWVITAIAARWLVTGTPFEAVREWFAVMGGPVAMAGMGATLGAVYGAITGIVLVLLVKQHGRDVRGEAEGAGET